MFCQLHAFLAPATISASCAILSVQSHLFTKGTDRMENYRPANLSPAQIEQLQRLEHEFAELTGEPLVLIAYASRNGKTPSSSSVHSTSTTK
ncbi:hypothetical protein J2W97_000966 [Paenibacillus jamilae]|uniref:hypothetical protein n=1 Tax=Paenibacillus TaxID=44249 RepID=UPI000D2F51E4|nr:MULTISPECIES: hypothetical protein [Paenibacillus]MDP9674983.1 hypothetical protein [Paenibacillus jamilae]KAF6620658.1 hypothetical protein HFE00_04240 [Paenibacillus sp. EKM101P]KAF6623885.1 hypothetical protein HFE03_06335 [Paenibacillus sp. EKM102P]KAF6634463.1 hypothetical protein HFE01_08175 [Paenibacillus sp. EKM10P]KAF6650393.1 hypothetical protein HFE02_03135 [Paenibacillus sp. EKM11P]